MQENNEQTLRNNSRLTLRITQGSISFSVPDASAENRMRYESFAAKSGMSQAARLREALRTGDLPSGEWKKACVLLDTPVLLVPIETFAEDSAATFYHYTMTDTDGQDVLTSVLPTLNAAAVFGINKDLRTVIEDHFEDTIYRPVCATVWEHLYRKSFTGNRQKLYAYFHERRMDVFAFQQKRFKFQNTFDAKRTADAVYFVMNVWKQLGYDPRRDELHVVGAQDDQDELQGALQKYLANVFFVNPSGEFNGAPVTKIAGMPYDLVTFYASR